MLSLSACFFLKKHNLRFQKYSFMNTFKVSNSLDQDHDRHSVGPGLGPKLSVDNKHDYKVML